MVSKIEFRWAEAQNFVQDLARLLATGAILWGLTVILGGERRWSAQMYSTAMQMPGAPESWGAFAILTGGLLLGGTFIAHKTRVLVKVGGYGCGIWNVFFALTFAKEAVASPSVSAGSVIQFAISAAVFFLVTSMYKRRNIVNASDTQQGETAL